MRLARRGLGSGSLLTALALGVAGCDRLSPAEERGPRLAAEWTGSDTGHIGAAVRVEWCDSLRMLEIRALHGDTGIAVAVYPTGAARPDSYPIVLPDRADSNRPASAVGIRWFAETAVRGFQGDKGAVVLERADDRVSGWFQAELRSINDGRRLTLLGSFQAAPVVPMTRGCMSRRAAAAEDSLSGDDDPADEPDDPGVD